MRRKIFITILIYFILIASGYAKDAVTTFNEAKRSAQKGDLDFAYIGFDTILRLYPESKYFMPSLFSIGEYYYQRGNKRQAEKTFKKFTALSDKETSKALPFAYAYLLKLSNKNKDSFERQNLIKNIVSLKRISLFFREFQEYEYESSTGKFYQIIYFIDRVKIYIDEELFLEVSF